MTFLSPWWLLLLLPVLGAALIGAAGVFGQEKTEAKEAAVDLKALHAKIGELTLENDFLEGALTKAVC